MVYKIPTEGIANSAIDTSLLSSNVSNALVPPKGIIMFSGLESEIPSGWYLCDGENGTPDLRNKFIVATATIDENDNKWKSDIDGEAKSEGGEATKLLGTANLPSHTHTAGTLQAGGGDHDHDIPTVANDNESSNNGYQSTSDNQATDLSTSSEGHTHNITGNTGDQGGAMGEAFDIIPTFFALAFIMRA